MATTPVAPAPRTPKLNRIGLQILDYRGGKTTLCAGCGHNAISERITEAFFEMGIKPERVMKMSGIGCSSKSPAYFMTRSFSFNSVHGRMPSVATGALLANKTMRSIGVSGDGDTASIGLGQFVHLLRRNVPMIYIVEDNGVYGLTKGQFSADKKQLSAMLKAALSHQGTVVLDVISPCVTFNDHEGSTKSYKYMQEHEEAISEVGFVPHFEDISIDYDPGSTYDVTMHDGSHLRLRKLHEDYNPTDRVAAVKALMEASQRGEVLTGVFYIETQKPSFTELLNLVDEPLGTLPQERVRPSKQVLEEIMAKLK